MGFNCLSDSFLFPLAKVRIRGKKLLKVILPDKWKEGTITPPKTAAAAVKSTRTSFSPYGGGVQFVNLWHRQR